jgi:hypothetical protein
MIELNEHCLVGKAGDRLAHDCDRGQTPVAVARRRQRGRDPDLLVQPKRDKAAALRLMRKVLKKQGARAVSLGWELAMSRVCARTTGPKTRTRP